MSLVPRRGPDGNAADWLFLLTEAEEFTRRTGYGLGTFWGCANDGDYPGAVRNLSALLVMERDGAIPPNPDKGRQRLAEREYDRDEWRAENGLVKPGEAASGH